MIKKIKFYKALLVEMIETLCTICLVVSTVGRRNHVYQSDILYDHFNTLKGYSTKLREQLKEQDK